MSKQEQRRFSDYRDDDDLVDEKTAARVLMMSKSTLENLRKAGEGPEYFKASRASARHFYTLGALRTYVKSKTYKSAEDEAVRETAHLRKIS